MKKLTLFFASLLCVTCIAVAQLKLYVYQNDGTRTEFVASTVDSIAFSTITDGPDQPDDPIKPEETIEKKLYFVNKKGWIDVRAYIWSAEEGEYIAWPGEYVYKENYNINGYEVYSYDMSDKQLYDMIIFNGLATSTSIILSQTSDLEIDYSKPYYYNEDWYASTDEIPTMTFPDANGHEYVDLGLPSGILWATCNVGANSPEDYGDYFAWGETEPKFFYEWSAYKWCNGSKYTQTKYCINSYYGDVDNKTVLDLSDDAANANWGGSWRMPTAEEVEELLTYCTEDMIGREGINTFTGCTFTGPNGNSIFLPATGFYDAVNCAGQGGSAHYWTSSLTSEESNFAYCFQILVGSRYNKETDRCYGRSVRPVMSK